MTKVRIFGPQLDIGDCLVDVIVEQIDLDGKVKLTEDVDTDPRTWTVELSDLQQWRDDNYAVEHSNVSDLDHAIWDDICAIYNSASTSPLSSSQYDIEQSAEGLFRNVVDAMRGS